MYLLEAEFHEAEGLEMEQQKAKTIRKRHATTAPHTQKHRGKSIDLDELLEVLMNVSAEDRVVMEWAYLSLAQDKLKSSLADAKQIVAAELQKDDVAQLLTEALVRGMLRGARWVRLEQARQAESKGPARNTEACEMKAP